MRKASHVLAYKNVFAHLLEFVLSLSLTEGGAEGDQGLNRDV